MLGSSQLLDGKGAWQLELCVVSSCWQDANGPIGLKTAGEKSQLPITLLSGHNVVKIASGNDHVVCLTKQGVIFSMGMRICLPFLLFV